MNQNQVIDLLQKLLVAGGPLAALLSAKLGWSDSTIGLVFTLLLAVIPPIVGIAFGNRSNTDAAVVTAASEVPGVKLDAKVDPKVATPDLVKIAQDPAMPSINVDPAKT